MILSWVVANKIANTALAGAAWGAARRVRAHLPIAAYTTWIAAVDWIRVDPPVPAAFRSLDRAVGLSLSFFFLALAVHYFLGRSAKLVFAAFALVVLYLFAFPSMTTAASHRLYFAVYDTTTALVWAMIIYAALFRRGLRPHLAHLTLLLYATSDAVAICFPLLKARVDQWRVVVIISFLCVVTSIVAHLVFLLRRTAPTAPAP